MGKPFRDVDLDLYDAGALIAVILRADFFTGDRSKASDIVIPAVKDAKSVLSKEVDRPCLDKVEAVDTRL